MNKPYVIGIDYGTLSARAVLLDTRNGQELAEAVAAYEHGVMDERLPGGKPLPQNYALQHPQDYLNALQKTVGEVLERGKIDPSEVAGLGIDFTSCTILPVNGQGKPLCMDPAFYEEPHAYVKLWKHHGAQPEADQINNLAAEPGEKWIERYGGKVSSEWMLPKMLETLHHAPAVFKKAVRFMEAGDWLSLVLTGEESHSASMAGYKALWNEETGYPSEEFLTALHPSLAGLAGGRLSEKIKPICALAGRLNVQGAALTGLCEGTALAIPQIDAHAAMPALGIVGSGDLMMIMGTSTCHILNAERGKNIKGICGCVKDGVIPGLYTYEAGQAAVGDIFDWFVKSCVPAHYAEEAEAKNCSIHKLLREKAKKLKVGESGLLALDWHNGNRSPLNDATLSGMILGLRLTTRPEEIYRALIEATAYGTRMIVDGFVNNGVSLGEIYAAGGIAQKDEMMMQIYADVLGRDIHVAGSTQAGARGSAIYASVAGGLFESLPEASCKLALPPKMTYHPIPENVTAYQKLYQEYVTLSRYFGEGGNDVMKRI